MKAISDHYNLNVFECSHLLGQCGHESKGFTALSENLNYSPALLQEVFPKYFPSREVAAAYAFKPEMIANRVYANRMGNGDERSSDGWKHRGKGPLQLTGKNNHKAFSIWVKDPEVFCDPDLIATKYTLESAIFFFEENRIFNLCRDVSDKTILTVSRAVNLGNPNSSVTPNRLEDRQNWTKKIYRWLIS